MHAQTTNLQIANMHGGGGKDTYTQVHHAGGKCGVYSAKLVVHF